MGCGGRVAWMCSPRDTLGRSVWQADRLAQEPPRPPLFCSPRRLSRFFPPVLSSRLELFQPVLSSRWLPIHLPLQPCSHPRPPLPFFIQWCGTGRRPAPDNGPTQGFDWLRPPISHRIHSVNEPAGSEEEEGANGRLLPLDSKWRRRRPPSQLPDQSQLPDSWRSLIWASRYLFFQYRGHCNVSVPRSCHLHDLHLWGCGLDQDYSYKSLK